MFLLFRKTTAPTAARVDVAVASSQILARTGAGKCQTGGIQSVQCFLIISGLSGLIHDITMPPKAEFFQRMDDVGISSLTAGCRSVRRRSGTGQIVPGMWCYRYPALHGPGNLTGMWMKQIVTQYVGFFRMLSNDTGFYHVTISRYSSRYSKQRKIKKPIRNIGFF